MSDDASGGMRIELLRAIGNAIANWSETRAAKNAGVLAFWRDGMLKQLELIADGRATDKTFAALRKGYDETEASTDQAIKKLKAIREKLGASQISEKIDIILNEATYGKLAVRDNIAYIISHHKHADMREIARSVCGDIRALNAEIKSLHRLVYP